MPNRELSDLTAASALASADLLLVTQSGNSRKATVAQLKTAIGMGWGLYVDNATALQANAVAVSANQRTLVTIDGGAGSITSYLPTAGIQWTANEHRGAVVGDSFTWRLNFNASKQGGSGTAYILAEMDIGDGSGPIIAAQEVALRSDSASHPLTFNFHGYSLDTFVANGARFYITPSVNVSVWGKSVFIRREFTP